MRQLQQEAAARNRNAHVIVRPTQPIHQRITVIWTDEAGSTHFLSDVDRDSLFGELLAKIAHRERLPLERVTFRQPGSTLLYDDSQRVGTHADILGTDLFLGRMNVLPIRLQVNNMYATPKWTT